MATTFTGLRVQDTYNAILKIGDNSNLTGTAKILSDGFGNSSAIYLSTTSIGIGVTPSYQLHTSSHAKIGGNLIVSGNLTVNGTLTYLNVEDLAVEDPLIKLAKDNTANTLDIGFFGKYVATGTRYKGLFNDASDDKFKLFIGTTVEPTTTVNSSASGYTVGTLVANLEGNVTGGTISGTTGTFSGDLSANNLSGTNTGDQTLPTDFVSKANGGTFGGLVSGIAPTSNLNFATKKYVDDNIPTITTPALSAVLSAGNTSGSNNIIIQDDAELILGTGSDFRAYHNQTNTIFRINTGDLIFNSFVSDGDIKFQLDNGSGSLTEYMRLDGGTENIVFTKPIIASGISVTTLNPINIQLQNNITVLNKAQTAYISLATRDTSGSEAAYNLTNLGTASFSGLVTGIAPTSDLNFATKKYVDDNTITTPALSAVLAVGNTSGSNDIIMSSTAKIGIGLANPGAKLHNYSTATQNVWISGYGTLAQNNWGAGHAIFAAQNNGLLISKANAANNTNRLFSLYHDSGGNSEFYMYDTNSNNKVKIDSTGNSFFNGGFVGIGTTSPDRSLDVEGNGMAIFGTGDYTELMIRGQVEGTSTVRNVGAFHLSIRGDVGGDNDDLKFLRFINGSYTGIAMQIQNTTGTIIGNGIYTANNSIKIFEAQRSGGAVASDWSYDDATTDMSLGTSTAHSFSLKTSNTRVLTIDSAGTSTFTRNVIIGGTTGSSGNALTVNRGSDGAQAMRILNTGEVVVQNNYLYATGPSVSMYVQNTSVFRGTIINDTSNAPVKIDDDLYVTGNVGVGITPSASFSGVEVLQLGKGMTIFGNTNDDRATMAANLILNTGTAFEYVMDGLAGRFSIEDGNMLWGTAGTGTAGQVATVDTKMTLLNNGALGIGTTSPDYTLHLLKSSGDTEMYINGQNGQSSLRMGLNARNWQIKTAVAPYLWSLNYVGTDFQTSNIITAKTTGNVGIGTDSPTSKLDIRLSTTTGQVAEFHNSVGYGININVESDGGVNTISSATNQSLAFATNATERVRVATNGRIGIGTDQPVALVHLKQSAGANIRFENGTTNRVFTVGEGVGTNDVFSFRGNSYRSTDTLSVVFSTNRVGIGIISPNEKLQVAGNVHAYEPSGIDAGLFASSAAGVTTIAVRSNGVTHFNGGNVAIGTTSPDQTGYGYNTLTIMGGTPAGYAGVLELLAPSTDANGQNLGIVSFGSGGTRNAMIGAVRQSANNNGKLQFWTSAGTPGVQLRMTIDADGNVGINESTPTAKLQVNGQIKIGSGGGSGSDSNNMSIQVSNATYGDTTNLGILVRNNGSNGQFAQIGFGYSESKCPVVIGSVITSGSGATKGDFIIGTRSTTTGSDAPTERMRVTSGGKVGIGTTSPAQPLSVHGNFLVRTTNADGNKNRMQCVVGGSSDAANLYLYYGNSGDGTLSVRINAQGDSYFNGGYVGIGITNPSVKLQVEGSTNAIIKMNSTSGTGGRMDFAHGDSNYGNVGSARNILGVGNASDMMVNGDSILYLGVGSQHMTILSSGNVGINDTTPSYKLDVNGTIRATSDVIAFSDKRVKENIITINNALNKVTKLRGVTYTRNDIDDKTTKIGVIAQEVLEVLPEVVKKDDVGMYSVAYGNMAGVFIEAIKELKAEVDSLKQEIKELKK